MKTLKLFGAGTLVFALVAVGCDNAKTTPPGTGSPDKPAKKEDPAEKDDHDHGPGPHGGTIIEFGRGLHAEFTVDHAKKQATVYILSGNLKNAAPLKTDKLLLSIKDPKFETELKADPIEKDPKGSSSRFVGTHEKLGVEQEFEGTVSGEVEGKPYFGDFKEEAEHHEKKDKK